MMEINGKKYEVIEFRDKRKFRGQHEPVKRRGVRVGKHLIVVPDRVYRADTCIPLIDVKFATLEDSVKFAEWVENLFGEYFDLWHEYPEADVFAMAKWSVPEGLMAYETIKIIRNKNIVDNRGMENAKREGMEASSYWTEQLR